MSLIETAKIDRVLATLAAPTRLAAGFGPRVTLDIPVIHPVNGSPALNSYVQIRRGRTFDPPTVIITILGTILFAV